MKKICLINAPQDHVKADVLKRHMTMLKRNGLIGFVDEVASADIVLVLLSNDMLNDDRAWTMSEEAKRRYKAGACRVVPILVEPMAEVPEHLVMLAALPRSGKPANTDVDWASIAGELRALAMAGVA